jgi:hypothetical protein
MVFALTPMSILGLILSPLLLTGLYVWGKATYGFFQRHPKLASTAHLTGPAATAVVLVILLSLLSAPFYFHFVPAIVFGAAYLGLGITGAVKIFNRFKGTPANNGTPTNGTKPTDKK